MTFAGCDDLMSPVGGGRVAQAYRNGRTVLAAVRGQNHRRGEKKERRGAGRSRAGTGEAGDCPAAEAAPRIAQNAPLAAGVAHRAAEGADRAGTDVLRIAAVANLVGADEAIGHPAEWSESRSEAGDHPAAEAAAPADPAQPAEKSAAPAARHASPGDRCGQDAWCADRFAAAARRGNRIEEAVPIGRGDSDDGHGPYGRTDRAPRDGRDGRTSRGRPDASSTARPSALWAHH